LIRASFRVIKGELVVTLNPNDPIVAARGPVFVRSTSNVFVGMPVPTVPVMVEGAIDSTKAARLDPVQDASTTIVQAKSRSVEEDRLRDLIDFDIILSSAANSTPGVVQ
jgi:hypothetical protein